MILNKVYGTWCFSKRNRLVKSINSFHCSPVRCDNGNGNGNAFIKYIFYVDIFKCTLWGLLPDCFMAQFTIFLM